ncbi:flippase-like domain-containing protein, partial [candidate division WWE3 bacterium]|nr:flippase-like domain-containing protein [candidate division WWE3 bacterium]
YLFRLYFIGSFFNNFLPTSIGGDVFKAYKLGKYINDNSRAIASTFMERFSGVVALFLFAIYGAVATFGYFGVAGLFLFWIAVLALFLAVKFFGGKFQPVKKFLDALKLYRNNKGILAYSFVTSVFVQVFSILTQHLIFKSLGYDIPLSFSFFAFPVIILASFVIPSQNSLGVQDFLYSAFFSQVGIEAEASASASIVYHLVRLLVSLIGGGFYATEK